MKTNLIPLVQEIQENDTFREEAIIEVISLFTPKIKSCLRQTTSQYQEDLYQNLVISVIEITESYDISSTPGFFEYIKNEKK